MSAMATPIKTCIRKNDLAAVLLTAFAGLGWLPASEAIAGTVFPVTSCTDDGSTGTLRDVVASAPSGATIDLRALACGTITLAQGEIAFTNKALTILGPAADGLVIDADSHSRIFDGGSVTIEGLTLTHGLASGAGGCVSSSGNVTLRASRVTGCRAEGDSAYGGGVFAAYQVSVYDSFVAGNVAEASVDQAGGGGIASMYQNLAGDRGLTRIERSTISGNAAIGNPGRGGGIFAIGPTSLVRSTLDGNEADLGGGVFCDHSFIATGTCRVDTSTLSGNTAHDSGGAMVADYAEPVFTSATIAFNVAETGEVGGVFLTYVSGMMIGSSSVSNTIIASNTSSGTLAPDFDTDGNPLVINGDHNLLTSQGRITLVSIIADPMLQPLADNGGPTQTHALAPDSPAVDAGSAAPGETDQRGRARVSGAAADIGAYELQTDATDAMFADGFDPG